LLTVIGAGKLNSFLVERAAPDRDIRILLVFCFTAPRAYERSNA
jgi:hypothetical protein